MNESCENCRFSASPKGNAYGLLECRRYTPSIGNRPAAQWPRVYPEAWCGEYEAKSSKAAPAPRRKRPTVGDVETAAE